MRDYRLILLLKSSLKKEDRTKLLDVVKKWANLDEKSDGITDLGEKKLAYPIKHNKTAEYVMLKFKADTVPNELDKRLQMNEDILRHLLVRD